MNFIFSCCTHKMLPLDCIKAKTLLFQVETNYPNYVHINRQHLFHFSRYVGKNINLHDISTALEKGWYASLTEFTNDLQMVFIQDVLFESLFAKQYHAYLALDFIQAKLGLTYHINVRQARSILHKFMDLANPRFLSYIKYDPRLFGFNAGICLSTCIIQIELNLYKSFDALYADLVQVGAQYCAISPVTEQTLELKELALLLQINFNRVKIAEQEEHVNYLAMRKQWCIKYMIANVDCIMYNIRYYREVFIPELELDIDMYFNIWFTETKQNTIQRQKNIPYWMRHFDNTYKSKLSARANFTQKWRREVDKDNLLFAIWLFNRQAIDPAPTLRQQYYSEYETHRFYVNIPFRYKGIAYAYDANIDVNEWNEMLISNYETNAAFRVWLRTHPGGTMEDFNDYAENNAAREAQMEQQLHTEGIVEWSQRQGFTSHRGKGVMLPYLKAHNLLNE